MDFMLELWYICFDRICAEGMCATMKMNKRVIKIAVIAALLLTAYVPALLWWTAELPVPNIFKYLRCIIYMGLFTVWGMSIRHRIIQTQVRRYLVCIATLMVFWIFVKEIKYHLTTDPDHIRSLWYAYYIPMLLIPALGVLIALSLGKPENYHLHNKWAASLLTPTGLLLLVVLTNDYHQLVFRFLPGTVWTDANAAHSAAYWLVAAWMLLNALAAISIIAFKCRLPRSRTVLWLPFIPFTICILYAVLYIVGWPMLRLFARDMTVVFCLLYAAVLESCIECGLIQNNAHYRELLHASTIGVQITDDCFTVKYFDKNAINIEPSALEAAVGEPVIRGDGMRLSEAPIQGGHVFWQENVSALLQVLEELRDAGNELQSYGALLQEENRQKARRRKLEEQKRLFNTMCEKTAPQVALLTELTGELEKARDEETARRLLGKVAVVGAYLKRRINLVFLAEQMDLVTKDELRLCLNESAANLRLYGIECAYYLGCEEGMSLPAATAFYDFFESAVELSLDALSGLVASFDRQNDCGSMTLMLRTDSALTPLAEKFPDASLKREDGVWYCTLTVREGGDAL